MQQIEQTGSLVVRQQKEWGEILSGFETRNKYIVLDDSGQTLGYAAEVAGSLLARLFLKAMRPFTIAVADPDGEIVLQITRPFRFYFHTAEVTDKDGIVIGHVERQFSWLRRVYIVKDENGAELFQLFGPILRPWTFEIQKDGETLGKITKKWSGLLKESFSDADNFGVEFPHSWEVKLKAISLGAVFLIDFVHFENTNSN